MVINGGNMAKRQLRTKVISLKVTSGDYWTLEKFAETKGLSVSTLCYLWVKQELADAVRHDSPHPFPMFQRDLDAM
jgi:hypothetical protein